MKNTIHWGIIGLGNIAKQFAEALKVLPDCKLIAVASRDEAKAKIFAEEYHAPYFYGTYQGIAQNEEVDVIYIATPHHLHYENTIFCLENKKAVLCEKPFAMNLRQVQDMIALAKKENVFLMEALWTKFLPSFQKVKALIESGTIGEIKMIQADFGFKAPFHPEGRLFNSALGGGSLLDVGIYPLFIATTLLGKASNVKATAQFGTTRIDESCGMLLQYPKGEIALLSSSLVASNSLEANIFGTEGRIRMSHPFHTAQTKIELIRQFTHIEEIPYQAIGNGYNYEAAEVNHCLRTNQLESAVMSHHDSLLLMEMLDWVRFEANIKYDV